MLAAELLLLLFVGAALAPDSWLGRWLIDAPIKILARMQSRPAVAVTAACLIVAACILAPEMVVLFGLADVSVLAEFTAIAMLLGVSARLAPVRTTADRLARAVGRLARVRPRVRARASRPRRARPPPDDVAPAGWALA